MVFKNNQIEKFKDENLVPPIFSIQKLKEILHYTDLDQNPFFEAFKSNCFYRLYSGAKGTAKSFNRAVETVFRFVNEKIFCSCWCRNQYSHIKNTLKPMFEKVFNFLKEKHGLDYFPFIKIYENAIYWSYDDGGKGRAIFFENWEKIQAFQGFTLSNFNFRFGELVIDEPIEDPTETKLKSYQLENLYELQESKLPLLIQNTINREPCDDLEFNQKKNITFCYNLFTKDHFVVKNYHNQQIEMFSNNQINQNTLNSLVENKYLQVINPEANSGLGMCVTMLTKEFIPAKFIDDFQKKYFSQLKTQNSRLWTITVAGFIFDHNQSDQDYFLANYIYDDDKNIRQNLLITEEEVHTKFENNDILYVFDGYDPGLSDRASWVRIGIDKQLTIYVLNLVEDLRNKGSKKHRELTKYNLIEHIQFSNDYWQLTSLMPDFENLVYTDNDIEAEWLNKEFNDQKIKATCVLANRKDSKHHRFGIENRQQWMKIVLENNFIKFLPGTEKLAHHLAKQVISAVSNPKRDESINPKIYDLINALEMACSQAYKIQLYNLDQDNEYNYYELK